MKGFLQALTVMWLLTSGAAMAQAAGSSTATTTIGLTVSETKNAALGWSAKKTILKQKVCNEKHERIGTVMECQKHMLGEPVFNEKGEKVGKIHDLIAAPDKAVSYAIMGTGGVAGLAKHHVAIPVSQFQEKDGKFVVAGATKAAIKPLPEFEYAKTGKGHTTEMAAHQDGKH